MQHQRRRQPRSLQGILRPQSREVMHLSLTPRLAQHRRRHHHHRRCRYRCAAFRPRRNHRRLRRHQHLSCSTARYLLLLRPNLIVALNLRDRPPGPPSCHPGRQLTFISIDQRLPASSRLISSYMTILCTKKTSRARKRRSSMRSSWRHAKLSMSSRKI